MLGNRAILNEMEKGNIVIAPFNQSQLGPNSYDLRLGDWIVRQAGRYSPVLPLGSLAGIIMGANGIDQHRTYLHVHSPDRVDETVLWGSPEQVQDGTILLYPRELILAHTDEIVECHGDIVGEMASRSTMMRNGIAVCVDAGLGDVGYASRWTMEIFNHTDRIVKLQVGWRIAQMKFHRVEGCDLNYEEKGGSYGLGDWKPEDMIPRGNMR